MKKLTLAALLLAACNIFAQDIYVPYRWTVNTARPAQQKINITRGETIAIEPTYISYSDPVDLTNCTDVVLRYRSSDMETGIYYAATGSVLNATNGQVQIIWSPTNEAPSSSYTFDILLLGADSASLKAKGKIKLVAGIGTASTNIPATTAPWDDAIDTVNNNLAAHEVAADATNAAQDIAIAGNLSEESDTLETVLGRGNDANNNINMGAHITSYGTAGSNYGYIGYYFSYFRFKTVNGLDSFLFQTLQPNDFGAFFDFGVNIGPGVYPGNGSLSVSNNITAGGMLICNGRTIADSKGLVIADGAIATNNLDDDVNASLDLADSALHIENGILPMNGATISNAPRVYLNITDYIYTDGTNLLWSNN